MTETATSDPATAPDWAFGDLFAALARDPGGAAVIAVGAKAGDTMTVTKGTLDQDSGALAAALLHAGLEVGDRVGLVGPNGPDWITCWLACTRAGLVAVALDDLSLPREVAGAFNHARCARVIASRAHIEALAAAGLGLEAPVIALDQGAPGGVAWWRDLGGGDAAPARMRTLDPAGPAILVYTSGTTGTPKCFELTRRNIAVNVGAILEEGILEPGDRVLMPLPLHHVYPLVVGLITPLARGAVMVLPARVAGSEIAQALGETGARIMIGVPRLFEALLHGLTSRVRAKGRIAAWVFATLLGLSDRLRRRAGVNAGRVLFAAVHRRLGGRLRIMVSGGALLEEDAIRRLDALGFEVLTGYGLAETASLFTGNRPGAKRLGTEGRVLGGGAIRIAAPDADGTGEIELKGPSVFAGYLDNPEANAAAFTADGWFRTGDRGRLDADGYLTFTGRSKEVIVLGGGKNVYPEELEALYGADTAIAEIAVTEHRGRLVALVRPDLAVLKAEGKTHPREAVRVALEAAMVGLPSFQHLAGFAVVSEPLPRTRLGKLRRFLLADIYTRATEAIREPAPQVPLSAADRALLDAPLAKRLWPILVARYGDRGLAMDASPELDLGIDSLEWVTLALEIENRLGVHLGEDTMAEVMTMRGLVTAVLEAAERDQGAARRPALDASDVRWIAPPGRCATLAGVALYGVNRVLAWALFRLRAVDRPALPSPGTPFMLVPNHSSDLDALLLAAALPLAPMRRLWWAGDAVRLFATPASRAICRVARIFPVDERRARAAIELARRVLERGGGVGWFPESWRTPTGEVQDFLPGVGRVLEGTKARVIPVFIQGSFEVMPRTARFPRPGPVTVWFGEPSDPVTLAREGAGADDAARIADALHARVVALAERARASKKR